jgi:DNA ligase-1
MIEAAKVIKLIKDVSSRNDKLYLLKKNAEVPGLKEILRFIYNPYLKTGIAAAKLYRTIEYAEMHPYVMGEQHFVSYQDAIKYFSKHNTGSDADLMMAARFYNSSKVLSVKAQNPFVSELAIAIVTQDLQIGVTAKSLNAVYGENFIPTVGCMLGTKIGDMPLHKVEWPCIVTEKLDGIRRILIKENGVCRLFSRSGHEDFGLVDIVADAAYLPDNRVYDGELLAIGNFKDSIALRQASSSRSAIKGTKHGLSFNVFDMLPVEEFYAGKSEDIAAVRKMLLGATLMDESIQHLEGLEKNWPMLIASYGIHKELEFIKPVPILGFVRSLEQIDPIVEAIWARGGEGVMLNTADGYYEVKRSKALLKVKHTEEHILTIVDFIEGTGKFDGMLGSLVVDYKGVKVGVGSGFDDALRQRIWTEPEKFIGRKVEVETFGESTNSAGTRSLNCPIFVRFADEPHE